MKKALIATLTAVLLTPAAAMAERSGAEVYTTKCTVCHATGAAGAPKLGDAAAWAPRVAQGIDALVAVAMKGKGAMPPKGLCMDCTPGEMKAAVEHMVNNSK
ncbi:MAG: c-type cytochrome [Marinobacterium sp.]|nr:c-type cytochrome [Marinobacterium sp.]